MEFLFITDIVKPDGMEDKEFFQIWKAESEAATAALDAGEIKHLWKAAGQYKVVGVFDFPDADSIDAALHSLPIWAMGHHEMAQNIQLVPLRDYRHWAKDLKTLGA
jgi:muconolactone delta-isomerase